MAEPEASWNGQHRDPVEVVELLEQVTDDFKGDFRHLEQAIGMYMIARRLGWKPMYLINSASSVRRSEKILGIKFREEFPEVGEKADKSTAWRVAQKLSSFWRAVRGDFRDVKDVRSPMATELEPE